MTVVKMSEKIDVATEEIFEKIIDEESLTGDRWINDEFYEELEYFETEPKILERTEDNEIYARFDLAKTLWFHEEGGVDVHIGIENTVEEFDGRSTEVDARLSVWFDYENGEVKNTDADIEIEPNVPVCDVSLEEPSEFHDRPYDIE
jgi:hypothetical protein